MTRQASKGKGPPEWITALLKKHFSPDMFEEIEGDLREQYEIKQENAGRLRANYQYLMEAIRHLRTYKSHSKMKFGHSRLLTNYLKVGFRNLIRQKSYSSINVVGLAVGIACVLLIYSFVSVELNFDRFHKNAEQIHRLQHIYSFVGAPIAPRMKEIYPEVEDFVRVHPWRENNRVMVGKDQIFYEDFLLADDNFFQVFSFELVKGEKATCLNDPSSLVISESKARQYFGDEDPIGKTIVAGQFWNGQDRELVVTGVFKDVPSHSHLQFDQVGSFKLIETDPQISIMDSWINDWIVSYLVLKPDADIKKIEADWPRLWLEHTELEWNAPFAIMPLEKIHLYSYDLVFDTAVRGNINQVRIFTAVGVMILVVAFINFVNLATARASKRSKEVGMRKALGAYRFQLVGQFLGEAAVITMAAIVLALVIVYVSLPTLETLAGTSLSGGFVNFTSLGVAILLLFIVTVLGAGGYPAFYLSSLQPTTILRSGKSNKSGKSIGRKGLVVFQFAVSIVLVVGVLVVFQQMNFMKNKSLGFNADRVVELDYGIRMPNSKWQTVHNQLTNIPGIETVMGTQLVPGDNAYNWGYKFEGDTENEHGEAWAGFYIGENFIEGLQLQVVKGRPFDANVNLDSANFMLNEAAWKQAIMRYGESWSDPIGKTIEYYTTNNGGRISLIKRGVVVGIIRDFHNRTLQNQIQPIVYHFINNPIKILVKIEGGRHEETLDAIESSWEQLGSTKPFNYSFVEDTFNDDYQTEDQFSSFLILFAGLALFIACLGLFGLASFTFQQRAKEVGIRKVLGASAGGIVELLSIDFLKLVGVAVLLAVPIAAFSFDRWLSNFAYRIDLSWYYFLLGAVGAALVALITVSLQSFKTASINPAKVLRND